MPLTTFLENERQRFEEQFCGKRTYLYFTRKPDEIKSFLFDSHRRLLDLIVNWEENQRQEMKETHFCGFNDGKQDCDCYLAALSDLLAFLKQ